MEARKIDLSQWEPFGAGGIGTTYSHKNDDSVILKLNSNNWRPEQSEAEVRLSQGVAELGLPTPKIYEFVTDGERFGHIDERIKNKKSLARIMSEDPSKIDEMAKIFAEMTKELHSTVVPEDSMFENKVERYRKSILDSNLSEEHKAKLVGYIDEMDSNKRTFIHGDHQPGNLIVADGKYYWIDLGGAGYGDPFMDLGSLYFIINYLPPQMTPALFHISNRQMKKFFNLFKKYYFGAEYSPEVERRITNSAKIKAGVVTFRMPKIGKLMYPILDGNMLKFRIIRFLASFAKIEL